MDGRIGKDGKERRGGGRRRPPPLRARTQRGRRRPGRRNSAGNKKKQKQKKGPPLTKRHLLHVGVVAHLHERLARGVAAVEHLLQDVEDLVRRPVLAVELVQVGAVFWSWRWAFVGGGGAFFWRCCFGVCFVVVVVVVIGLGVGIFRFWLSAAGPVSSVDRRRRATPGPDARGGQSTQARPHAKQTHKNRRPNNRSKLTAAPSRPPSWSRSPSTAPPPRPPCARSWPRSRSPPRCTWSRTPRRPPPAPRALSRGAGAGARGSGAPRRG